MTPVTPAEEESEEKKELVAERTVDEEQWPRPDTSIRADSAVGCRKMCQVLCSDCRGTYHEENHHCICQRGPLFPYTPQGQRDFASVSADDDMERGRGGEGRGRVGGAHGIGDREAGAHAAGGGGAPRGSPSERRPGTHLFAAVKKQLEKRQANKAGTSEMEAVAHTVIDFLLGRDQQARTPSETSTLSQPPGPHASSSAPTKERGRSGGVRGARGTGAPPEAPPSSSRRLLSSSAGDSLYASVMSEWSGSARLKARDEADAAAARTDADVRLLERDVANMASVAHGRHAVHTASWRCRVAACLRHLALPRTHMLEAPGVAA